MGSCHFISFKGEKQPMVFLEKKMCLVYPSALQALSGLEGKDGDVPGARSSKAGVFLVSDEQLSFTPISAPQ